MSDEQAEKVQKEDEAIKKKQEEAEKRLWVVTLILDPESGQFAIQNNENVQKQWQLNTMIAQAVKQTELTETAKVVGQMVINILKAEGVIKTKKKMFKR